MAWLALMLMVGSSLPVHARQLVAAPAVRVLRTASGLAISRAGASLVVQVTARPWRITISRDGRPLLQGVGGSDSFTFTLDRAALARYQASLVAGARGARDHSRPVPSRGPQSPARPNQTKPTEMAVRSDAQILVHLERLSGWTALP
ncbi:MAG TPA: hypothetical protein VN837_19095, partial [Chloroflexota bacterium]|nr:hypothetical protein [Chloroflexota bacterium]